MCYDDMQCNVKMSRILCRSRLKMFIGRRLALSTFLSVAAFWPEVTRPGKKLYMILKTRKVSPCSNEWTM